MGQWETLPVPAAPKTLPYFGASQQCLDYAGVSRSVDQVLCSLDPEEGTWSELLPQELLKISHSFSSTSQSVR